MIDLIEPKEITITTQNGVEKVFVLSKIPYMSGGREICSQFIPSALPKVGEYALNEALSLKMMGFIAAKSQDTLIRLQTRELVNNHVPDFQTGLRLEKEMLEYNFGFFDQAKVQKFLTEVGAKARELIMPTLIQFVQSSLKKDAPPSTN